MFEYAKTEPIAGYIYTLLTTNKPPVTSITLLPGCSLYTVVAYFLHGALILLFLVEPGITPMVQQFDGLPTFVHHHMNYLLIYDKMQHLKT